MPQGKLDKEKTKNSTTELNTDQRKTHFPYK